MGNAASYCEICGAPVNLVVSEIEGRLEFQIGPEHQWLADVVGLRSEEDIPEILDDQEGDEEAPPETEDEESEEDLPPPVVHGKMDDHGTLTAAEGVRYTAGWIGGYRVVHARCWRMAGQPQAQQLAGRALPADIKKYQLQYFDYETLLADGNAWMLADPEGATPDGRRARERIERLTQPPPFEPRQWTFRF